MKFTEKIFLYYNTLRYLKPVQFIHRFKQKFSRPRVFSGTPLSCRECERELCWIKSPLSFTPPDEFSFLNENRKVTFPEDWNNSQWPKLWLYNLHYFDWLRQADLSAGDAEKTIGRWIEDNSVGKGNGWEPYTLSLRIVNWIKWHLAGNELNREALDSLMSQVCFLSGKLEYHLLANHLLANAKALIFAGLFFQGEEADKWLETGMDIYRKQLPEQILADGGHFELSPMYHSIILEDLLDVYNLGQAYGQDFPALKLPERIIRMFEWLYCMTHLDGRISLFNDAAFNIAPDFETLKRYAESLDIPLPDFSHRNVLLKESGYGCFKHGDLKLIADVGRVGPDYQPGHAHADTLSFELSCGARRIIVDTGTSCYGVNPVRLRERRTASHNTISVAGKDSSEIWSAHRVAGRAGIHDVHFSSGRDISRLSASHDGYARIARGLVHKREWSLDRKKLMLTDTVKIRSYCPLDFFLHFAPGVKVEDCSGNSYILSLADDEKLRFKLSLDKVLKCKIDSYEYASEFGKIVSAEMVCGQIHAENPVCLNTTIEKI